MVVSFKVSPYQSSASAIFMSKNVVVNQNHNEFPTSQKTGHNGQQWTETGWKKYFNKLSRKLFRKCHEDFFITALDIGYFLAAIPFRFISVHENEKLMEYRIQQNRMQQIICGVGHMVALGMYFAEFRHSQLKKITNNPLEFLTMFLQLASFYHHINFVFIFWTKSKSFLKIVQCLKSTEFLSKRSNQGMLSPSVPQKWITFLTCIIYPAVGCLVTLSTVFTNTTKQAARKFFFEFMAGYPNRDCLHNANNSEIVGLDSPLLNTISNNEITDAGVSDTDTFLMIGYNTILYFRNLMGFYTDCVILVTCFTLWFPVREFSQIILTWDYYENRGGKKNIPSSWKRPRSDEIVKEYQTLKRLSNLINEATTLLIFSYVIEAMFSYPVNFQGLLVVAGCLMYRIRLGLFFLSFCVFFYFTAEICRQVDTLNVWLSDGKNRSEVNGSDLQYLLYELSTHPIGLYGNGIFVINYSFVATVFSVLMTYFIVSVQSQGS